MQLQKQSLINSKLFLLSICTLLSGYSLMAFASSDALRLTLSPIVILIGFSLVVLSIIIPSKK